MGNHRFPPHSPGVFVIRLRAMLLPWRWLVVPRPQPPVPRRRLRGQGRRLPLPAGDPVKPQKAVDVRHGEARDAGRALSSHLALPGERSLGARPHAMVAAGNDIASAAGREVLRRGGNAIDATVAISFAMAVVDPEAGNLGGGGFMLIRLADGSVHFLDYREQAPLAATRDMYLDADGKATDKSQVGYLASGTPGSVMGLVEAQKRFGRLPFAEVINPAIVLARDGFVLDSIRSARIREDSAKISMFPATAAIFLPGGHPPPQGAILVQHDMAHTLEAIRDHGRMASTRAGWRIPWSAPWSATAG